LSSRTAVPRFSIVVPTFDRRDLLIANLALLAELERPWPCELVVVVDGSQDGSLEAARSVELPFPSTVVFQENAGAAAARNRGAAEARGEILLFLDDDMAVDRRLLLEHDEVLRAGADAVVGNIPLHPESPRNVLTLGVGRWAHLRAARLRRVDHPVALEDLLTGQLSVRATTFRQAGGFDESFNRGGTFGAEDTDFLYRLVTTGCDVRAAPDAISYQRYVVTAAQHLRQWRQGGRADGVLVQKHPELADQLTRQHLGGTPLAGLLRAVMAVRPALVTSWAPWVVARADAGRCDRLTQWTLSLAREAGYWAGRMEVDRPRRRRPLPVLAYHAVEAVDHPLIGDYSVSPHHFAQQMEALVEAGWTFVTTADLLAHLEGRALGDRSVLLTFDDGYVSFAEHAVPVLRRLGIPAVVFLVTALVGGENEWDTVRGATSLPLLDAGALRELQADGWEFGAHSRTHTHLASLSGQRLRQEVEGPRIDFTAFGLDLPLLFAYPFGEHALLVRRAARRAGYRAALALEQGSGLDAYAFPRVEVRRGMGPTDIISLLQRQPTARRRERWRREGAALVRAALHLLRPGNA
jgi:peptidoglycan/xylan/chitin deacetylase (PgdA/CDA1 family)/GT2 family glycosyltransferase